MQLEAEIKNGVLKKKVFISGKSFEMGYGHKIQSKNPINYFIMTKQIVCTGHLQILPHLYL